MKKIKIMLLICLSAIAVTCIGAFTACSGGISANSAPSAVNASTITYDGTIFKWGSVSNASSYLLTINGTERTSYSAQYTWSATSYQADSYVITIVAQNTNGSSAAVSAEFFKLDTIEAEDITFDETGVMSWTAVNDAASYIVEVNNTEYPVSSTTFSNFEYGVRNTIRVKAVGASNSYFALWTSSAVTKTYLGTPTNIQYDGQYITWTAATASNTTYSVYINGNLYESGVSGTSYQYDSNNNDFDVSIQADGNGTSIYPSKVSDASSFVFLGEVTNIEVNEDGILEWDAVEKATSYQLQITDANGNYSTKSTEGTTYTLSSGATFTIKIKPIASDTVTYFSTWSAGVTVSLLNSPTLLWNEEYSLTDGNAARALYWNSVSGDVAAYNIKVVYTASGSSSTTSYETTQASNPSFEYAYLAVGTYEISVQSVASVGSDWSNSTYSSAITVIRLAAPNQNTTNFVTSDATDISKGFTVYYTGVSGATSYRLIKDSAETNITSTGTSMAVTQLTTETSTATQTIHYAIQSVGSVKTVSGATVVTLSSLTEDSLDFTITILATPVNVAISGDTVSWDMVSSSRGYAINYGVRATVTNNYWSLQSITTSGTYSLSVCAMGDGAMVLPSNYTAAISVIKLAAPTNIKIGTTVDEGKLSWDSVDYAQSYNIYLNGNTTPVTDSQIDNMNNHISSGGVTVVMQSVANYWNDSGTVYYISSENSDTKLFTKLQAVNFKDPAFEDNQLVWNAPSNVTTSANITYRVYVDGYLSNGAQDGTSMDVSYLAAGTHSFYIQCIGDGSVYVNSDVSTTITITKLETPTVTRSSTVYQWKGVTSATSYEVWVDGSLAKTIAHTTASATYDYTPAFASVKTYSVQVYAIGDNGNTTIDSSAYEITQTVSKLSAPEISISYDKENYSSDANIVITITKEVSNITGYIYTVNGVSTNTLTETEYKYNAQNHGKYVVSVTAVGGVFDEDGTYWYTSDAVGGNDRYTITVLDSPNVSGISITQDGVITGFSVTGVSSYTLVITYKDGTSKTVTVESASYVDDNYTNIASISVCCNGNGTTTISSEYVTWTKP